MIVLFHKDNRVTELEHFDPTFKSDFKGQTSVVVLQKLATLFPDSILVWCREDYKEHLNRDVIKRLFNHKKLLFSYHHSETPFLSNRIGYLEDTPFIKINRSIRYPTWLMSDDVGAIHSAIINACLKQLSSDDNLGYYLNSLAKMAMPLGIMCYSEPTLLLNFNVASDKNQPSEWNTLFKFTRQHYKKRWLFLLLANLWIYEKQLPISAFFPALFYGSRKLSDKTFDNIVDPIDNTSMALPTVDVLIPTIGREKYLYDVLKDLNLQSHLPKNVIIVEQNPDLDSKSTLDYLTNENWNFQIKHTFTHQSGACNARNIALDQITSEAVFFADDDIRMEPTFIADALTEMNSFGASAVTVNCHLKGQISLFKDVLQWPYFGSGCSFVKSDALKGKKFQMGYEFGFGEDTDFGMQLRNAGCDIIYLPKQKLLHLKAPVGGFRVKPDFPWKNDPVQPKPSPTIMLYLLSHLTTTQLQGYKTVLLFKFFKHQEIKNPFKYYKNFNLRWEKSQFWANELMKK